MTHTVENDRIRVTVPIETWNKAVANAGSTAMESPESIARGVILSRAMSILANRSELKLLKEEGPQIEPKEVEKEAQEILIAEYLYENRKYEPTEVLLRRRQGRIMSAGMIDHLQNAIAYARGVLDPPSSSEMMSMIKDMAARPRHEWHRIEKRIELMANGAASRGDEVRARALELLMENYNNELQHRTRPAPHWKIEIIGELPDQVGFCRLDASKIAEV